MRDQRAVRHHYDVSNEFFAHFLDESMTYSCAVWDRGATTLEEAQFEKLDMVCRKLALKPGDYVLDVGSGWGSFARHAAREYGARVLGITLSPPQAELARQRTAEAGLADKIEFQVRDYRDLPAEEFDAVSSIGMVEHVGSRNIDAYLANLHAILKPGGRLLNHGIARVRHGDPEAGPFSERYVFPDGAPLHLSRVILAMERARYVIDNVEGLHGQYERTLQAWVDNLESDLAARDRARGRGARARLAAVPAGGAQRVRDAVPVDVPGPRAQARVGATARPRRSPPARARRRRATRPAPCRRCRRARRAARPPRCPRRSARARCRSAGSAATAGRQRRRREAAVAGDEDRVRRLRGHAHDARERLAHRRGQDLLQRVGVARGARR